MWCARPCGCGTVLTDGAADQRPRIHLVRILARLVSLPFALLLLAVGSFALLSSYGDGSELADQSRRQLQAWNRAANKQGADLPGDFAVTFEEAVAESFLRFVLLPGGLVLFGFSIGLVGRPDGDVTPRKKKEGDDETSEESTETRTDKRVAKKIIKQAKALKKAGDPLEAADLLWANDLLDEAAEIYVEAGEFSRAAEIRHDQNRFIESAELHLEGENYEAAGSIFGQQEEWARAADCYLKCDHKSVAAEMYEKAGQFREAAQCYRETDFLRHAAAMYVKCKDWMSAATALEQVFVDEGGNAGLDPKKAVDMEKLVRQAGKLYLKAQEPDKALAIFVRGSCSAEAGEVSAMLGDHESAAAHYRQAGLVEKAAESLRTAGQGEEAARLLGQHLRDAGQNVEAAALLEEAGDLLEAGDLYRSLEDFANAARCYESQNSFAAAAEMHGLAGDRERAGAAYEQAGRFTEAAECFALAGQPAREAELLEKAGDFLRAGEGFHREGMDEEAIGVLQKIQQEDPDFGPAAAILGDLFASRGQTSLAITKLQQAIGDTELTRESVDGYYKLASLYHEDGKSREALEIFEKVMAFDYHYGDVEERLAEVRAVVHENEPIAAMTDAEADRPGADRTPNKRADDGRYQIVGELGRGGMGIVYKVQDTVLDRLVAFKVLPQALTENTQAIQNFMREAQAAAKLNHPNIVTVYDTGEQAGRYYIAMEYVEGTTLKEILRRRGADLALRHPACLDADQRGARLRAREEGRPSRHQARERHVDPRQEGQADGLRPREGRRRGAQPHDRRGGDALLHEPRADARQEHRPSHGHLLPRCLALRDGNGDRALQGGQHPLSPRAYGAAANPDPASGSARVPLGDRGAMPREGSGEPLSVGARDPRRSAELPAERGRRRGHRPHRRVEPALRARAGIARMAPRRRAIPEARRRVPSSIDPRPQGTLEHAVECEGVGLHTGAPCRVRIAPADEGGRVFVTTSGRAIPATIDHVVSASRATTLGLAGARGETVSTVEHLLASLASAGIDHARIEVSGAELPALDGSAREYVTSIASGGWRRVGDPAEPMTLDAPLEIRDGARSIRAEPAAALALDVTIDFALPSIGRQRFVVEAPLVADHAYFTAQIAPARTFALREEVDALQAEGLARGGSLDNAIVFGDDGPVGDAPLRFPDECVRHKTIDLLGDLALLGRPLAARVVVERGGHALHHQLVRALASR